MDRPVVACILAGGTGNRLYPASRPGRPKQFLTLGGDRSLLSRTLERPVYRRTVRPDHRGARRCGPRLRTGCGGAGRTREHGHRTRPGVRRLAAARSVRAEPALLALPSERHETLVAEDGVIAELLGHHKLGAE
nr:sugar phosphate nucleotidyltransferase [Natronococcus sp. CG52]